MCEKGAAKAVLTVHPFIPFAWSHCVRGGIHPGQVTGSSQGHM